MMASPTYTSPEDLPDSSRVYMDFRDSAFFKVNGDKAQLPTPEEVRNLSPRPTIAGPKPVVFNNLNLLVKFGHRVTISEALCLWLIPRVTAVPVPELYGWRVDGGRVYIYKQLINGDFLLDRWESLTTSEKTFLCKQLNGHTSAIRQIEQHPSHQFIGSIDRKGLIDYVFENMPQAGPFCTVKDFHDWISRLPYRRQVVPEDTDPWRPYLPDGDKIVLTHGDLHRANIIISASTSPPHVMAIIDWGCAGWCPEYWDYGKAIYTASTLEEWGPHGFQRF